MWIQYLILSAGIQILVVGLSSHNADKGICLHVTLAKGMTVSIIFWSPVSSWNATSSCGGGEFKQRCIGINIATINWNVGGNKLERTYVVGLTSGRYIYFLGRGIIDHHRTFTRKRRRYEIRVPVKGLPRGTHKTFNSRRNIWSARRVIRSTRFVVLFHKLQQSQTRHTRVNGKIKKQTQETKLNTCKSHLEIVLVGEHKLGTRDLFPNQVYVSDPILFDR